MINPAKTQFLALHPNAYAEKGQREIHFCNRVFKNSEDQQLLERFIFEYARKHAYMVFPNGATIIPDKGVKVINNRLIKVTGDVVFK